MIGFLRRHMPSRPTQGANWKTFEEIVEKMPKVNNPSRPDLVLRVESWFQQLRIALLCKLVVKQSGAEEDALSCLWGLQLQLLLI